MSLSRIERVIVLAFLAVSAGISAHAQDGFGNGPAIDPETHPQLVVQTGVAAFLGGIAISSDGALVITGDGARLWDATTGRELRRLNFSTLKRGSGTTISDVKFFPDGRRALTCGPDNAVRLWDLSTSREIRSFVGHTGGIRAVAISPDGTRAVTGSTDKTARLWNVTTSEELRSYVGHGAAVNAVTFSMDGEYIFTGSDDKTVRRWDVGQERAQEISIQLPVAAKVVSLAPDERRILIGCRDGTSRIWGLSPTKELSSFRGHTSQIVAASWSADGTRAITVAGDKTLRIWDTDSGEVIRRYTVDPNYVFSASFTADRKRVVMSGSDDRSSSYASRVVEVATGAEVRRLRGYTDHIRALAFSPDGRYLLMGKDDGTASLWDLSAGREANRFEEPGSVTGVRFSPDGKIAMTGAHGPRRAVVSLWDVPGKRRITSWDSDYQLDGAFSPDSRLFLSVHGGDRVARIRAIATDQDIARFEMPWKDVSALAFAADGRRIITIGRGVDTWGTITHWDLTTGKELQRLPLWQDIIGLLPSFDVVPVFSPDGRRLLTVHQDNAFVWETSTGASVCRLLGHSGPISAVAFTPEGQAVVTGSKDGTARLWDVATGKETVRFTGHTFRVSPLVVTPDGRHVLSSDSDQNTCLWDARTGRELCRLVSFRGGTWVVISPDGRFDTNTLEGIVGLHWVFPDDPFRTLAPEVFLRDYYEPRLLPRLMAGESFRPVRALSTLNRVQPAINFVEIVAGPSPGVARVKVETQATEDAFGGVQRKTGVYQLRLFRDNQLVGCWPDSDDDLAPEPDPNSPEQMEGWRRTNRVAIDPVTVKATRTFSITLPHRVAPGPVEFTAYAFNEDRVKSTTATARFNAPANPPASRPRAYLICMGVAANQSRRWDLAFPAVDARRIQDVLGGALERQGRYEVVPVLLTSERDDDGAVGAATATKANLDTAFDLLAGREVADQARKRLPGADRLRAATPDDLVFLSFSGHGYTDARGVLYLLPYDVGDGRSEVAQVLPRCISTSELSAWLRGVDAGELAVVVDACHSAAAVQQPGFKPGPLGSRGLGQLAYDKGMQVLAASQADDVAVESARIRQGLLTYALASDGLEKRRAARDGIVTLKGLLTYAAGRVPGLYHEVMTGEVRDEAGAVARNVGEVRPKQGQPSSAQQPELFNYDRNKTEVILSGATAGR
jgi:WD40 repeat protein